MKQSSLFSLLLIQSFTFVIFDFWLFSLATIARTIISKPRGGKVLLLWNQYILGMKNIGTRPWFTKRKKDKNIEQETFQSLNLPSARKNVFLNKWKGLQSKNVWNIQIWNIYILSLLYAPFIKVNIKYMSFFCLSLISVVQKSRTFPLLFHFLSQNTLQRIMIKCLQV